VSPTGRLWTYLLLYRWRYGAGIGCLVAATGLSLGIPWTVKAAIDDLGRGQGGRALGAHIGTILLLAAAHGVFRLGSRLAMIGAGQRVEHDVRRDLYAHLQRLPPAFYHRHLTGDLMSRATSDIAAVRALAGFGTVMLVGTSLTFAGTVTTMGLIDPQLTVAALAPFPLLVVLAKRFNHAVDRQSTAVQEQLGALSAKVQENLAGAAVVRAYTMEGAEIERFARLNQEFLTRSARLARTQAGFTPLMGLIAGAGTLVILWLGGRAVVEERITLGALVAFNGYLAHLAWPTIALGWTLASFRRGVAAMARIAEILESPVPDEGTEAGLERPGTRVKPDRPRPQAVATKGPLEAVAVNQPPEAVAVNQPPEAVATNQPPEARLTNGPPEAVATKRPPEAVAMRWPSVAAGALEVRNLTFAYDGREPALRDVSFSVPAGALVAVVGPTGAGKSTLAALLVRLFEPPPGTLLVDGVDVRAVPFTSLRRLVASVPQEPFLFSRSLRENLRLGDDAAGEKRLAQAVAAAGLDADVAALPGGLDTLLGERGVTLSGGQRARVTLARALAADPPILVLDDPFAAVDPDKEHEVLGRLRAARAGRTTVIITHRLRSAAEADWVVTLSDGRVVEQGTPADLAARGGLYARLWRLSQIEDDLERSEP
jgi:ABC-type multidrug transport system fused ATPase/permease subunit